VATQVSSHVWPQVSPWQVFSPQVAPTQVGPSQVAHVAQVSPQVWKHVSAQVSSPQVAQVPSHVSPPQVAHVSPQVWQVFSPQVPSHVSPAQVSPPQVAQVASPQVWQVSQVAQVSAHVKAQVSGQVLKHVSPAHVLTVSHWIAVFCAATTTGDPGRPACRCGPPSSPRRRSMSNPSIRPLQLGQTNYQHHRSDRSNRYGLTVES
jgi:hypothetical protein